MDSPSDRQLASPDDLKPEERRSARACDYCHRMKMKCIGKEDPPCNRCRAGGHLCTFDGPRKSKNAKMEERLKLLEDQMEQMQRSMVELLARQHGGSTMEAGTVTVAASSSMVGVNGAGPARPTVTATQGVHTSHPPAWMRLLSAPPDQESGAQSEDEDDPLEPHAVVYNNMLSLAEAARLKADGQLEEADNSSEESGPPGGERKRKQLHPFDYTLDHERAKRPRRADESILLKRALPPQRGNLRHQFQNPVELGFCTAETGKRLFDLFMNGAVVYVPILDPAVDTWENMLRTSPFTVTVLIMVGSKIEDAGGPPSELQTKCKRHAENIAMHTLFTPISRIDVLQAMIILSSWGDTSWRPGGHALRIAMDMGLYRCLPYLAASGMGADKTAAELADERPLVVGARCWLAVYKSEFEMAFNLGRPALFAGEDTLKHCRKFLEHPLALQTDSRLVAACELLTLRLSLHQPFSIWPAVTRILDLDERIEEANETYHQWFKYWEEYCNREGVPHSSFIYESLYSQRAHALLHTNSRILHAVRSQRAVALLSEKRKRMLVLALRSAETLVSMALRGAAYASGFVRANYYTHVGVAFAARMLIRLTSLLPEHVADLRQTGRDLEAVARALAQVPGFSLAAEIRDVLVKARRRHVLPPSSRAASPTRGLRKAGSASKAVKGEADMLAPPTGEAHQTPDMQMAYPYLAPPSVSSQHSGPDTVLTSPDGVPYDFSYAEQLFAGVAGSSNGAAATMPSLDLDLGGPPPAASLHPDPAATRGVGAGPDASVVGFNLLAESLFNTDMWFPYPPLESDGSRALSDTPTPALEPSGAHTLPYW